MLSILHEEVSAGKSLIRVKVIPLVSLQLVSYRLGTTGIVKIVISFAINKIVNKKKWRREFDVYNTI